MKLFYLFSNLYYDTIVLMNEGITQHSKIKVKIWHMK